MIPIAEARRIVLDGCRPLEPTRIDLAGALGHVLAEAVSASGPVPPFDNSAMDGYALRAADTAGAPARLRVVGAVMAGDVPRTEVGVGEAVRIMTGAPVPPGADAVCMVEHTSTEADGAAVVVHHTVPAGANVRYAGEDVAAGDEVLAAGTALTPARLGVLAGLGVGSLRVHPHPRVGVVSTGDELVEGSSPLRPGTIRDTNRPALVATLRAEGWEAHDLGLVGDDEAALTRRFEEGASTYDALVASGGVSVGDRDVVKLVLQNLCGRAVHWMQVAVKPAKPFAFGRLGPGAIPVFGLPGNPVSALVSYELFVRPALRVMAGHRILDRPRLCGRAEVDIHRRRDGKVHLVRVVASTDAAGRLVVRPSGGQGSHMLLAMAGANALAVLPDGDGVAAGGDVDVLLLDAERLAPPGPDATRAW